MTSHNGIIIALLLTLFAAPLALAHEYPVNVKPLPCPETGLQEFESSPQFYIQYYGWILERGKNHNVARCNPLTEKNFIAYPPITRFGSDGILPTDTPAWFIKGMERAW